MEDVPSVKGSIFQSVADDVRRLMERSDAAAKEVEAELDEGECGLLEDRVTPLTWVPISTYGRMLELLARLESGGDRRAYLRDRGRRAAERLLSGTYEAFAASPGTWGRRTGEAMLGIGQLLYNFSHWSFAELPGDVFEISAGGAAQFPDAARETAHGFLAYYAARASGQEAVVESERPSPDRIVYRIRLARP